MMASNSIHPSVPKEETHSCTDMPPRPLSTNSFDPTEHLYTNHFTCSLDNNISLYQYDMAVEEIDKESGSWKECEVRSRATMIMQSIILNNQLDPNVFVWYDEQKCLYSTSSLTTPQVRPSDDGVSRLNIKSLSNQWSTNNINDYINGETTVFPYDAVRIIETLLKRSLQGRVKIIKNKSYFLNDQSTTYEEDFEKQYGLKQRCGFIQRLNLSSCRLTLNIETKSTIFYSNISLLEFIHKQIGSDRMPTDNDYKKISRLLKNCLIVTDQIQYKFERFDYRRPYEIHYESGQLLIDYYREKKNIILTKTNYPCIKVSLQNNSNTTFYLPLEVCQIKEWRVCDEPLLLVQEPEKHIHSPEERYYQIINTLQNCNYNTNLLCQAVGFHIDDTEMLDFNGRILISPNIRTGLNYQAHIDDGQILLGKHICEPKPISTLAITYFGTNFGPNKINFDRFTDALVDVMECYNMYERHEEHTVKPTMEHIDGYFRSMSERNCQFIVCLMDRRDEDDLTQLRVNIKTCGTIIYGIMTQCARYSEIPSDEKSLRNYCESLVRKINFKNGGINVTVDLDVALKNRKSPNDFYMFFGAVLIPPTNMHRQHPFIAALVGSSNASCSTTAVRVCEQYPKRDICFGETIVGMTEMLQQLLDYNCQVNQRLPNRIVFYRDRIDPGQFTKILEREVPAIRQAFDKVYGDQTKHPLLTLIVVNKRHNTRFFTYNPNGNQWQIESKKSPEETNNMSIGCVIDTTIVHPYQHNFYLNSHNSYQGVNHPPLYHVLLDEIGFTADELQLLTYHLCFTDPRSSASEAVPSVVHQADVAALNARDLFYSNNDSSTMDVNERSRPIQNPTSNLVDYKILQVHENLTNKPVFS